MQNKILSAQRLQRIGTYLLQQTIIIIISTARGFKQNKLSLRSSALTYTTLLSLVPILAMSTAVVKGLGGGDQLRNVAYSYIQTLEKASPAAAPTDQGSDKSTFTTHLRSAVKQVFDYVDRTNFATLGSFGMAGIILSVILVFSHIETAMNAIWKVHSSRSIMRKLSDYVTLLVLMPISINIAFAASAFLKSPTLNSKIDIFVPFAWLQTLLFQFIPVFFIALTLYVIYLFFPNTKVKNLPAALGALLAGSLWFFVQNIYIGLQIGVGNYNAIYGSFATVPLFLIWMYLGWVFILFGAQFAFAIQNRKSYSLRPDNSSPALQLGAAFDIINLVHKNPLAITEIEGKLTDYSAELIKETITKLHRGTAIHIIEETYLVPTTPRKKISSPAIISIILGQEFENIIEKKTPTPL
ncbi:YihY/virulence factor BrkB family protein [Desulfotalea psychrophila]|uniref:Related to ribonuclease BN n=1 Tax=Desulfotalea psychrophila (strain LSv54 / DSM 12343) TaxID=177439 RepID=Q6AJ75_DESPS|nr:YihY/virulence factor BrkB family protein [Desulfotalea psychrophila]CAG37605.1 related to ribonuclease BN [Desulfotalea psychrophila LSv54]